MLMDKYQVSRRMVSWIKVMSKNISYQKTTVLEHPQWAP